MNALTWKEVLASLNPSPVFEAVAVLAEGLAMNDDESVQKRLKSQPILRCRGERQAREEIGMLLKNTLTGGGNAAG